MGERGRRYLRHLTSHSLIPCPAIIVHLFIMTTIIFVSFLLCSSNAAPIWDAGLLLSKSPISRIIHTAASSNRYASRLEMTAGTNARNSPYFRVHVSLRKKSSNISGATKPAPSHYLFLTKNGRFLIIDGETAALLPFTSDTNYKPALIRASSSRLTVVMRKLSARISDCRRTRPCLRKIIRDVCDVDIDGKNDNLDNLEVTLRKCTQGNKETKSLRRIGRYCRTLNILLMIILTSAQLGVFLWGALFSMAFFALEFTHIANKFTRSLLSPGF